MAGFASPDCSTFSKLHHLPGGPPFLRGLVGKDRYGLTKFPDGRPLTIEQIEHVRIHTLVSVRVAEALDLFVARGVPWIFETPEICPNQISMAHLDEFVALLKHPGVKNILLACSAHLEGTRPNPLLGYITWSIWMICPRSASTSDSIGGTTWMGP